MNKKQFSRLVGGFTWNYNCKFLIETPEGNFIWSNPDYPFGDNSVVRYHGSYEDWIQQENIPYGRYKGKHVVENYIGMDFSFKEYPK